MHFTQTNEWARFQQTVGKKVYSIAAGKCIPWTQENNIGDDGCIGVSQKIGGPLYYLEAQGWQSATEEDAARITSVLREAGGKIGAVFVRWTPVISQKSKVKSQKFVEEKVVEPQILIRQAPPKATIVIDVSESDDMLLKKMHEKTRYNIRLAERKGVQAHKVSVQEGFEAFWCLMRETASRDKIGIHAKDYYRTMLETVQGKDAHAYLFLATYNGAPRATAILILCGDTATYLHGGSSNEDRNVMAPHVLQWRMMQYARQQGMRWYDMWGVSSQVQSPKSKVQNLEGGSWAGITRFKMGFGGEVREYAGTFDIVVRPLIYSFLTLLRRMRI